MSWNAILAFGVQKLREAGIEEAACEARILLAHAMGVERGRLTLHLGDPVEDAARLRFDDLIEARAERQPVSHLLGYREFYDRRFRVSGDVLDPRPETETLISVALGAPFNTLLDLGTGSGAIAVTLLAERETATATATDISPAALAVATDNADTHGVTARLHLKASNWFEAVGGSYDLIVSNPPYIALDEMAELSPELGYEPRIALTDEGDGLSAYREIAKGAPDHLTPEGRLLVEIGRTQAADVAALFTGAGMELVAIHPDLDGRDRVVEARLPR